MCWMFSPNIGRTEKEDILAGWRVVYETRSHIADRTQYSIAGHSLAEVGECTGVPTRCVHPLARQLNANKPAAPTPRSRQLTNALESARTGNCAHTHTHKRARSRCEEYAKPLNAPNHYVNVVCVRTIRRGRASSMPRKIRIRVRL